MSMFKVSFVVDGKSRQEVVRAPSREAARIIVEARWPGCRIAAIYD